MKAFPLPQGIDNWNNVKERITWCETTFGPKVFAGAWEYNAVSHMIVIRDPECVMLYSLRWS